MYLLCNSLIILISVPDQNKYFVKNRGKDWSLLIDVPRMYIVLMYYLYLFGLSALRSVKRQGSAYCSPADGHLIIMLYLPYSIVSSVLLCTCDCTYLACLPYYINIFWTKVLHIHLFV